MNEAGLILKHLLDRQTSQVEAVAARGGGDGFRGRGRFDMLLGARGGFSTGPELEQLRGHIARIHSEADEDVGGQFARIDEMGLVSGLAGKLDRLVAVRDRKSTRLNSSHPSISY